jgi:hypothetical protein
MRPITFLKRFTMEAGATQVVRTAWFQAPVGVSESNLVLVTHSQLGAFGLTADLEGTFDTDSVVTLTTLAFPATGMMGVVGYSNGLYPLLRIALTAGAGGPAEMVVSVFLLPYLG